MNSIRRNNVKISGHGPKTMIFAHGYGCNQNMWRLITPAFEKDYQLILFDHTGAGKSDISSYDQVKYGTLSGYADDIIEICKDLDLSKVVYVGHSVATIIGILAAVKAPSLFEKLILIGPSPCYIDEGEYKGGFSRESIDSLLDSLESNHTQWSNSMAPVIMGNLDRPQLASELAQSFCETKPEIAKHFAQVTFLSDNRKDLDNLKVDSLILQCQNDNIAPEYVGKYMHSKLKNSKLINLKATGHCPHLSAPEETIQAMKNYLQSAP